jgi:parallel beta-helix repeat protein
MSQSNRKTKTIGLLILGIFLALSPIFSSITVNSKKSSEYSVITLEKNNLKISAVSGPIYIDDTNPSSNWSIAKNAGICTGNGTYSEPYIIEDLVIDGGGSGSCIWIENSNVYFRVENCTVYNSGGYYTAGIRLISVNNSRLINNNCSFNFRGIFLESCNNNTISGNYASNNEYGINLDTSNNNIISGNVLNSNDRYGIDLYRSKFANITGNIMNECGLTLAADRYPKSLYYASHIIDTTNVVNGKPLIYYSNELNLGPNNYENAGQLIFANCNNSLISNLNISDIFDGISFYFCYYNEISGNFAEWVKYPSRGIYLFHCSNNVISGNTMDRQGIMLEHTSINNTISGNIISNGGYLYVYRGGFNITITGNIFINSGIRLEPCWYSTISGNIISSYQSYGIRLLYCDYNTVSDNTLNNNTTGIGITDCEHNNITGNIANNNNNSGIYLAGCEYNTISRNIVKNNNKYGIFIYRSDHTTILGNNATNNGYGIYLSGYDSYGYYHSSDNNTITENIINHNSLAGIYLEISHENTIYLNCFNNSLNAIDNGLDNKWDNGIKGNYWSDYIGSDVNNDGIGDAPYYITGSAGSKDNFPLMKCEFSKPRKIEIPFELIILISIITGGALIGVATLLLIRRKRKIIE